VLGPMRVPQRGIAWASDRRLDEGCVPRRHDGGGSGDSIGAAGGVYGMKALGSYRDGHAPRERSR